MKRFIIVVLDSVGVGSLPDAALFGTEGSNTLGHIAEQTNLSLPHLQQMGLGNILPLRNIEPTDTPTAAWGRMAERSMGMDTTTGHWEIAGLITEKSRPTFPHGFPADFLARYEAAIGRKTLGNCVASGVKIIQELGPEHMKTGYPIVYTSADSVFQLAAHEEVIPVEDLYAYCHIAREMLVGDLGVGRVIARPFLGNAQEGFYRTERRHDFSLLPPAGGMLEKCQKAGIPVHSIGKIYDIFAQQNIDDPIPGSNNEMAMDALLKEVRSEKTGLYFVNLVDFDMKYGHPNDVVGYQKALERFDAALPELMASLRKEDILVITADHGNDPTTASTDHCREYVPLLVYGKQVQPIALGTRATYADLGQTAVAYLGAEALSVGNSFLAEILK